MKHILLVDDSLANLKLANNLLKDHYKVSLTKSGQQALDFCKKAVPDLILLDVNMPDMDGFETITYLKDNPRTSKIPVIFITATNEPDIEVKGFDYGAVDFITKPFVKSCMLRRIDTHLQLSSYQMELEHMVRELEDSIVTNFSQLIECRHHETGGHVERTKKYVEVIANELMKQEKFVDILNPDYINELVRSAPLHDIGKIGVSDLLLLKESKLTEDEYEKMKSHTIIGEDVLKKIMEKTPVRHYLELGCEIAGSHHERFDGKGYPRGLRGDEIPLSGRIMAVADVYDALISNRVYRKAMSQEEACEIIESGKGKQFDPQIIEAFEEVKDRFYRIAKGIE